MKHKGRIAGALLLTAVLTTASLGSRPSVSSAHPKGALLDPTAPGSSSAMASAFAPIRQSGEEAACGSFLPPRLVTIGGTGGGDSSFVVDVVVGTNGVVESVLILDATKPAVQSRIADRVSRWVYKPALCNGVPVASEGQVEVRAE